MSIIVVLTVLKKMGGFSEIRPKTQSGLFVRRIKQVEKVNQNTIVNTFCQHSVDQSPACITFADQSARNIAFSFPLNFANVG
jgi:hypothetical protein